MKKNKIILLVCLFCTTVLLAQNNEQSNNTSNQELAAVTVSAVSLNVDSANVDSVKKEITIKKGRYYLNDVKLSNGELKDLLKNDPASASEYKKSRSVNGWGTFTQIVVQVGVSVGLQLSPGGILVGALAGLVAVIPFIIDSGNHYNQAIKLYNLKHANSK